MKGSDDEETFFKIKDFDLKNYSLHPFINL